MSDVTGLIVIVTISVGLPMIAVMVSEIAKRQIAFKERKLELMADKTAEKAAQYAAHVERLSSACACSNGLPPTRAPISPTRSKTCATGPRPRHRPTRN